MLSLDIVASERRVAGDMIIALEQFRKLAPKLEVQTIITFFVVARSPGIRMKDIEKAVGLSSSAVSRNILFLSSRSYTKNEQGEWDPGLDLVVAATDPFDVRAKVVSLTPRGRRLYETVVSTFDKRK